MCVGVGIAFALAVANRALKLAAVANGRAGDLVLIRRSP
jgi:hypothetical protein